jgi:hypothetical protein
MVRNIMKIINMCDNIYIFTIVRTQTVLFAFLLRRRSWGSSVRWRRGADWTAGVLFPAGARDFSLLNSVQTGSGAYPAFCPMGTGELFPPGLKRLWREADRSPRSSAESRMLELYLHSSTRIHSVVLN